MNELKEKLASLLNLDEEQAQQAVDLVTAHLKSKLPESFHGMIDRFDEGGADAAGGAMGMVKGLFGGK